MNIYLFTHKEKYKKKFIFCSISCERQIHIIKYSKKNKTKKNLELKPVASIKEIAYNVYA